MIKSKINNIHQTSALLLSLFLTACGGSSSDPDPGQSDSDGSGNSGDTSSFTDTNMTGIWLYKDEINYLISSEKTDFDEDGEVESETSYEGTRTSKHQDITYIYDNGTDSPEILFCTTTTYTDDPSEITTLELEETESGYTILETSIVEDDGSGNSSSYTAITNLYFTNEELLEGTFSYSSEYNTSNDDYVKSDVWVGTGTASIEKVGEDPGNYLEGSYPVIGDINYNYDVSDDTSVAGNDELFCISSFSRESTTTIDTTDSEGNTTSDTSPSNFGYVSLWGATSEISYYIYGSSDYNSTDVNFSDPDINLDLSFIIYEDTSDEIEYSQSGGDTAVFNIYSASEDGNDELNYTATASVKFPEL